MESIQLICNKCGAMMRPESSGSYSGIICPYCGNVMTFVESDTVKLAKIKAEADRARMGLDYIKHREHMDADRLLFRIRVGIICGVAAAVIVLICIFLLS